MRKLVIGALWAAAVAVASAPASASTIREVAVDGAITPVTVMKFERAIADASAAGDDLILVTLDTPGGLADSTWEIVKAVLASKVPVAVWVGPAGAHAASAGFYILMSADVSGMAPGTRTGAAATVYGGGQKSEEGDVLLKKANEDAKALLRSMAERRGRNAEAAEKTVTDALAYTETEALAAHLVDLVEPDRDAFLRALDGREVKRFDGSSVVLHTSDPKFVESKFDLRGKILEFVAHPAVAFLLLTIGSLALWVEFSHPGLILPGVVGVLCLLLFAFSAQALPVSALGVLLILLAMVLFILEIKVTSYGLLTAAGIGCLLLGSLMLIDGPIPELRVPLSVVLPTVAGMSVVVVFVIGLVSRAQRARVGTGVEGLAGEIGRVTVTLAPEGKVFVHGEIWDAAAAAGEVPVGTRVRVVRVENLTLVVEPVRAETEREGD